MAVAEEIAVEAPATLDSEICHMQIDLGSSVSACGSEVNCPAATPTVWQGQSVCTDCGRPICPECLAISHMGRLG